MKRRDFLKAGAAAAVAITGIPLATAASKGEFPEATAAKLPRWYGFNLLSLFMQHSAEPFPERDFEWMADWGFNFVRLPMDYRCWTAPEAPYVYDEKIIGRIDQAVEFGKQYGIHVSLNLHRAPGYTVAKPAEELDLWKDEEARKRFDHQWAYFAQRYKGNPSRQLSFDLVNEPANVPGKVYAQVAARAVGAIREADPDRLIIADGMQWGREPVPELIPLGIAQSTRGYDPFPLTHYLASWAWKEGRWAEPTWPLKEGGKTFDRTWLAEDRIRPWKEIEAKGVGVHVGEWGVYNKTPANVAMAWMKDCLSLWKEAGWGWALWNFRGSFGILDSERRDVSYENFKGHQLDSQMLELLQEYRV